MRLINSFEFKQRLLAERGRFRNNSPFECGVRHGIRIALRCMERSGSYSRAEAVPVRQGRWEPYIEDVEIYNAGGFTEKRQTGWICGKCKSRKSITPYYKTNYCPNCGAKMDEED